LLFKDVKLLFKTHQIRYVKGQFQTTRKEMVVQYFKMPFRPFPGVPEDIHKYNVRILNFRAAILIRGILNTQQEW